MPLDPPQPFRMSRNPSKRTDTMIIYNDPMKPFQAYQGYAQWGSKDLTGVMFHLCSYEKQYQLPTISREFVHCWEYEISSLVLEGPLPHLPPSAPWGACPWHYTPADLDGNFTLG